MNGFKEIRDGINVIREIYNQTKLAGEVMQYKLLLQLVETPEYQKIEDDVEKSLDTPGKLKELAENKDWRVRFALALSLTITSDMPEELLKEAKEVAEKLLLHDRMWAVRLALAQNSDIEPNFFAKLAEKLAEDKDWRVKIFGLGFNENTPKELGDRVVKENKKVLEELTKLFGTQKDMEELQQILETKRN